MLLLVKVTVVVVVIIIIILSVVPFGGTGLQHLQLAGVLLVAPTRFLLLVIVLADHHLLLLATFCSLIDVINSCPDLVL